MKLKSVEFYQSVRLWNNQEKKTIDASEKLGVQLIDHLVILSWPDEEDIIVPTANMRHGRRERDPVLTSEEVEGMILMPDLNLPKGEATVIKTEDKTTVVAHPEVIEEIKKSSKGKKTK